MLADISAAPSPMPATLGAGVSLGKAGNTGATFLGAGFARRAYDGLEVVVEESEVR